MDDPTRRRRKPAARRAAVRACVLRSSPGRKEERAPGPPRPEQDEVITVRTTLVELSAVVTDARGRPVEDLRRKDCEVFENDRPRQVGFFSVERVGANPTRGGAESSLRRDAAAGARPRGARTPRPPRRRPPRAPSFCSSTSSSISCASITPPKGRPICRTSHSGWSCGGASRSSMPGPRRRSRRSSSAATRRAWSWAASSA
jgi:hypothetical protein